MFKKSYMQKKILKFIVLKNIQKQVDKDGFWQRLN